MKKILITFTTLTMLAFSLSFGLPVLASNVDINSNDSMSKLENNDIKNFYDNPYFNVTTQGEDTIITITDSNLVKLLEANGVNSSSIIRNFAQKEGVSKIVWHGQARYGNVDVYLSKTALNNVSAGGIGVLGLILAVPSLGYSIASLIAGLAAGNVWTSGQVFRIRGFAFSSRSAQ